MGSWVFFILQRKIGLNTEALSQFYAIFIEIIEFSLDLLYDEGMILNHANLSNASLKGVFYNAERISCYKKIR